MKEDLLKIIEHYGISHQQRKLEEEVFELQEAILVHRLVNEITYHIAEEIADVMVMLNQFIEYYNIDRTEIELIMNEKIKRQLGRIENE
jgi:NTP pyrophosphatase (non-canonical NTP hydrolase)